MQILQQFLTYILSIFIAVTPVPQYVEGIIGQPQTFLPNQVKQDSDRTISKMLYRGLFTYNIYGTLIPDLAETWSISDDGIVYTIKLKDNQFWHNGKKITSTDLIYTSFNTPDLEGVATDKVDDLTVRYTLPNKYSPFLSLLTVGVIPENSLKKGNPIKPISSGDFKVVKIERSGDFVRSVTMDAVNPNLKIKRVSFKYYTNEDELITASKLGEIMGFMTDNEYKLENFQDYKFPLQGIYYGLFFNLRNESLKDLEFRKNLEKALPVEQFINDRGIFVQGPVSRSVFTDQDLKFDNYDPLFKKDYSDKQITLTIPSTEDHYEFAQRIQQVWKSVLDIDLEIKQVPVTEIVSKVIEPRDFELLLYGQEIGRDPDRYVYWHSTQKDSPNLNITGFEQVRADRALEEGRNEQDNEKRIKHYNEFQKVIMDEAPAIFLYHPYKNYYVSKYIKGIGQKYTFTTSDRFLDFYNWEKTETN